MKMNKKFFLYVFILLSLIPIVSAQGLPIPSIVDEAVRAIFGELSDDVYQRLILFIGVFIIFYAGLQMSPVFSDKETKRGGISITLALVLSAIATLSMPSHLVNLIFTMYSGIFGIILLFGPILWLIYASYKYIPGSSRGGHFIRFLLLAVAGALLLSKDLLSQIAIIERFEVAQYLEFAGFILIILAIIELFKAFGSGGTGDPAKTESKGWGDGVSNWFSNRKKAVEEKRAEKEAKLEKDEAEHAKKIKELGETKSQLDIIEKDQVKRMAQLIKALDDVQRTDTFLKQETRVVIIPNIKQAIEALKSTLEKIKKINVTKKQTEDDSVVELRRVLDDLEKEYKLIDEDTIVSADLKKDLLFKLRTFINKINNTLKVDSSLVLIKKKYKELVTEISELCDRLDIVVDDIAKYSGGSQGGRNLSVEGYSEKKAEYSKIIDKMNALKEDILSILSSIQGEETKKISDQELVVFVNDKEVLVKEIIDYKNNIQTILSKVDELKKQADKETNEDSLLNIAHEIEKLYEQVPSSSVKLKEAVKKVYDELYAKLGSLNAKGSSKVVVDDDKKVIKDIINIISTLSNKPTVKDLNPIKAKVENVKSDSLKQELLTHIKGDLEGSIMNSKFNANKEVEWFSKYLK